MLFDTTRLAWRNLGRNRRRTLITGAALAVGISLSVASFGLMDGMSTGLLDALTRFDLGHIQVHSPTYPEQRKLDDTIADGPRVLAETRALSGVRGASPRVYGYALVSHGPKSLGVELVGVDPKTEPGVTTLDEQVIKGRYLDRARTPWPRGRKLTAAERARDAQLTRDAEARALAEIEALEPGQAPQKSAATEPSADRAGPAPDSSRALARIQEPPPKRPPRVIIGDALARVLRVGVGDEISATGRTVDGASQEAALTVAGIFKTGTTAIDRGRIYLHIADLQRFAHLSGRYHEIAALTVDPDDANAIAARLQRKLGNDQRWLVRSWSEIRPDIRTMIQTTRMTTAVMIFIILFVATLGVVNTMLMAVFERTRELGVLKALGMSGGRIVGLIVSEAILLVLLASAAGTAIGLGLDAYMIEHGVDLSSLTGGVSVGGVGINPVLYGEITATGLILPTLILAATCLVASLYPAIRAARLRPAVGMRET
jgi:ABC-type lipoprotein release transport system permease subunit